VPASKRDPAERQVEGVITGLVAKQGRSQRVAVQVDGRRAFDLAELVVEGAGLHVGDRLTRDDHERLVALDLPYRARERALRFLALRDRSCQELRFRLQQAGFPVDVADETVAWLVDLGYLNDARFAASYVAEKARGGWGDRRIAAELAQKGVGRKVVDEALSKETTDPDEAAQGVEGLVALVRRRFAAQLSRDPEGATRRLAGFLGRRGYDWDTIHAVIRKLQQEAPEAENGPLP